MNRILGFLRAILTPNVAPSAPNATTGRVPLWWTALVAALSAVAVSQFGAPLCP